jgi:hypothetical protein
MNPSSFAVEGEQLLDVMTTIVVLSFLVERALAVLFENRWFVDRFDSKGVKEPISVLVAFAICRYWDFDAVSVILMRERTHFFGHLVTAGIIAGGSKASVKLFHDVLNVRSSAEKERQAINEEKIEAARAEAKLAAAPTAPSPLPVLPAVVVNVASPTVPAAVADSMAAASNAPVSGVMPAAPAAAAAPAAPTAPTAKATGSVPPPAQRPTVKPPAASGASS